MRTLFWRDMLIVGTMVNLYASLVAMLMVAQGVAAQWALLVHLAPLPYNIFLLSAVWRSHQSRLPATLAATAWLVAVTIL